MEGQVWKIVWSLAPDDQPSSRRFRYSDREILVVVWAILHDRPMCWACQRCNWPPGIRPARLAHPSTVSRRWRREDLQQQARLWHRRMVMQLKGTSGYAAIDGRGLTLGGCSKDPDARSGRAAGGMGKGYKFHAMVGTRHEILDYLVRPLNIAEQKVAVDLLRRAPRTVTRVVGDTNYDSMNLHRVAADYGRRLYTPLRQNRVGRRAQAGALAFAPSLGPSCRSTSVGWARWDRAHIRTSEQRRAWIQWSSTLGPTTAPSREVDVGQNALS